MFTPNLKFIMLGAGEPYRNSNSDTPNDSKVYPIVLEWLLAGAAQLTNSVCFVGGYRIAEVKAKYPHLSFIYNKEWKKTKASGSFLSVDLSAFEDVIISYTDIIYRDKALTEIASCEADIAVAIDTNWLQRYQNRDTMDLGKAEKLIVSKNTVRQIGCDISLSSANAEFVGLSKMSRAVLEFLSALPEKEINRLKLLPFSDLIEFLRLSGFDVQVYDVKGEWAELNDPRDIGQFILGTKAETLMRFQKMVKKSVILDQISFSVADWQNNRTQIVSRIIAKFDGVPVIIRSSALSEDNFDTASAGLYESRGNVDSSIETSIIEAIDFVIGSYVDGMIDNQVLVQHMLQGVSASGVVFSRALSTAGPYFVINYDDESGATDTITGGSARTSKTYKIVRSFLDLDRLPLPLPQVIEAVLEVETLSGFDSLDIEFAVGDDGVVYLFQVRPLINKRSDVEQLDQDVFEAIEVAKQNFEMLQDNPPHIVGSFAIFGAMPDWNPAEIIGTHPKRLAADLYADLILDDIWARQRAEYNYRDVRPQKLMRFFCGQPYVDVRASLNSFVPAELDNSLAERLVDFFLLSLSNNPDAHDKIEFEIVPTCFDLNFGHWQNVLKVAGFRDEDILAYEMALRELTSRAIKQPHEAVSKLEVLQQRFDSVFQSALSPAHKACLLLEDAKEYGTLPFAHLARDGFVAVALLKSGVEVGLLTQEAVNDFMRGLNSVTRQLAQDAMNVKLGQIDKDEFLSRYGHLRPDTYNIASHCYHTNTEIFIRPLLEAAGKTNIAYEDPGIWNNQKVKFFDALLKQGIGDTAAHLEDFLVNAIEGREYSKFLFTRNLSAALELFAEFGATLGFKRSDLASVPLDFFKQFVVDGDTEIFSRSVREWEKIHRRHAQVNSVTELPELLKTSTDFDFFSLSPISGNFIGESSITASCIYYHKDSEQADLSGKVVFIENADPGYDWLFGVGIQGLITKFGGINSHMAIRSAEFGLPAVIGVGEIRFSKLASANTIQIDCQNKIIRRIN